jgi:hypothetical protein
VAFQERVSDFQRPAVEENREGADHFSGEKPMKRQGQIIRCLQDGTVAVRQAWFGCGLMRDREFLSLL